MFLNNGKPFVFRKEILQWTPHCCWTHSFWTERSLYEDVLSYLSWILPKFTTLNRYFQSANMILTTLHNKMIITYTEFFNLYLKPEYVARTSLKDINLINENHFIPLKNIYLGIGVIENEKNQRLWLDQTWLKTLQGFHNHGLWNRNWRNDIISAILYCNFWRSSILKMHWV